MDVVQLSDVCAALDYDSSAYYREHLHQFAPNISHIFRTTAPLGVKGIYVLKTNPGNGNGKVYSTELPAVFLAETHSQDQAQSEAEVREMHKKLWNLGSAPFFIAVLPHQIRIYTGFTYAEDKQKDHGLIGRPIPISRIKSREHLRDILADFSAQAIDSGHIWQKHKRELDLQQRVDTTLLKNLRILENALRQKGLSPTMSHALIGKYVYLRYLWDREILTPSHLHELDITEQDIFAHSAHRAGLARLVAALETWLNGRIFPIDFDRADAPTNEHIALVASTFRGDVFDPAHPELVQLHLNFKAYDFRYIPVETLSAVYEQFIPDPKASGAVYTPEFLADYLLSEVHTIQPLTQDTTILDPACGSGIFLVLAYRQRIEQELVRQNTSKLSPEHLKALMEGIYGVERERDACYVTQFSLILTLLNYIDQAQLNTHTDFKLPCLHNTQIFHGDFFDEQMLFWQQELKFDWIVGNPPWIELKPATTGEAHVRSWIETNSPSHPVSGNRVAEAFSWRVVDCLNDNGVVGLLLPATSLVNIESRDYRQHFFAQHTVFSITNFANLRENLFGKGDSLPPASIIYRKTSSDQVAPPIIHYAPLYINQVTGNKSICWSLVISENDIQLIDPDEQDLADTTTWKLALWGTPYDRQVLKRLRRLFPMTLEQFCASRGWGQGQPCQGAEFTGDSHKPLARIGGKKAFRTALFNKPSVHPRFSIYPEILEPCPQDRYFRRGQAAFELTTPAPHIILSSSWGNFIIYSEEDFIIPPRQMGIAAPVGEEDFLRSLTLYLQSSLALYYVFFQTPQWGIFGHSKRVVVQKVRTIPTPNIQPQQARVLAALYDELQQQEHAWLLANSTAVTKQARQERQKQFQHMQNQFQQHIDATIFEVFAVPSDIQTIVKEFVQYRLLLDEGAKAFDQLASLPTPEHLMAYAQELRDSLDEFVMGEAHHHVSITWTNELIECVVEITEQQAPIPVTNSNVIEGDITIASLLQEIRESIGQQFSQWSYIQRGLRLFDGPKIYLYKMARLIDWTRTQAMVDASDSIEQLVGAGIAADEAD